MGIYIYGRFGEPVDVHLVRNKKTGASRGFCFLAYEDARSCAVVVDNMNGSEVCGRTLRVDHVKQFKPPREYLDVKDDDPDFFHKLYRPSGPDGAGWGEFRQRTKEEEELA
jgi:RNA-binding motif X-linked protein 2